MLLSELEKLLAYINMYHNPEQSVTTCELPSGYTRKMVVDIDCKMVLHKNWLPAGRVSVITLRTDNGEEKSFDVYSVDWQKHECLLDIKLWLIGAEPSDWYGLTFSDSDRKHKFFKQVLNFRQAHPDFNKDYNTFIKEFMRSLVTDPFYMSEDEMYRELERAM